MNTVKRGAAVGALWLLASGPVHAEMSKGESMGPILWAIFLITAVVPLLIALVMRLLVARVTAKRPSLGGTLLTAFGTWWCGIYATLSNHDTGQGFSGVIMLVLLTAALSAGVACLSVSSATSDDV